jgi:hypothetical protein
MEGGLPEVRQPDQQVFQDQWPWTIGHIKAPFLMAQVGERLPALAQDYIRVCRLNQSIQKLGPVKERCGPIREALSECGLPSESQLDGKPFSSEAVENLLCPDPSARSGVAKLGKQLRG